jgi:hypothetical protein
MFELKAISKQAIPRALGKVERYRLLNEPGNAESICRDILEIDPENQAASVALVLTLTDQFSQGLHPRFEEAKQVASRLTSDYEREYYLGIICERRGRSHHRRGTPGAGNLAYDWLHDAMAAYENAEKLRPEGNDDALLRWNSCARFIVHHPEIQPVDDTSAPLQLE